MSNRWDGNDPTFFWNVNELKGCNGLNSKSVFTCDTTFAVSIQINHYYYFQIRLGAFVDEYRIISLFYTHHSQLLIKTQSIFIWKLKILYRLPTKTMKNLACPNK